MGRDAPVGQAAGMIRTTAAAAPAFMLLYALLRVVDGLDGDRHNGPAWDVGHVAFFIAFVFFGALVIGLRRVMPPPRWLTEAATVSALLGVACFLWVITHDLFAAVPSPDFLQFTGPALFQAGLLTLLIRLVVAGRLPVWSPVLTVVGFAAVGVDLDLLPLAAVLIGAGLVPLMRGLSGRPSAVRSGGW